MQSAVRQTVTVQKGGLIEVRSSELQEGTTAEVIVLVDTALEQTEGEAAINGLSHFIGTAKGSFSSPTEADAFVRQEREA